ncbi:MAG: ABC transporter permease [Cyclobacteriaceae bacterium]|nr:ABC transporter permease [Cyclobacteriaceae bacterium]MCB0500840.1 ABC transporter permease [Cyclobacteriaceae bacterium]MCB9239219.1 ABC transporter permease [Flammeovirgaceae bacterium]MCO5272455.1 ABC transporter permease [Cyclobacteriaceae bacterium]MCW5903348.1 ABC transporter permease [Cyclobacteriaceae bacterium]
MRDNYPEVENAVRFFGTGRNLYKYGDQQFYEEGFYLADSTVFDMFDYEFISGDKNTALDLPYSIVLTESISKKYFGTEDPMGKSIKNQQNEEYKVTGLIKDVPENSHFRFDALQSRSSIPGYQGSWGNFGVYTYIELPRGYDLEKMYTSLDTIVAQKVDPIFKDVGISIKYELQPIADIHLHSKIQDEAESGGDISYIYIFGAIACFMIIIACINYMNLATARSANRGKEVGVRKVMVAQKPQLITQFITESVLIALISLLVSLVAIYLLLPAFNSVANKSIPFGYILQGPVILSLVGIVVFVGIVGGSYPAFYLSGFNPVNVLKGKGASKGGSVLFRKALVITQFSISIFMLISTMIVFDQLEFIRNKDLGFQKERVIKITLSERELRQRGPALVEKFKQSPLVEKVGMADASPGEGIGKLLIQVEDSEGKMVDRGVDLYSAGFDFVPTMGMEIVQGRNFSRDVISDTTYAVLVNEAMVKRMNWADPIGRKFVFGSREPVEKRVVGVVKDYNQNSLYDVIEPLMIILNDNLRNVFVRVREGDVRQSLASLESIWNEVNPNFPFEYNFLDQDFDSQYKADEKRSKIFTVFSALTLSIACLGLLGLAAFTTEQRTNEIGVRKVIGASVPSLIILVTKEFFILVAISMVMAFPVAWHFTDGWLQNFAYRIELTGEWLTFILSVLLAFLITMATVGFHVIRAAIANPVNSLRDE